MIGTVLAHYRIDSELGRGGMGIVYKATDTKLNRTVALKVLPASALASEDDRARFFREAQSAAQLHHPNIATVFQIDEAIPVESGKEAQPGAESRLFIAMEYIEGETLGHRIKAAPLPLQEAVNIAGQIAEALKAAHAKNIVHRDIKSANVMLTPEGVAKVLDFGLAKTNQSTMLTRMGSTLGTVAYMSPEQARGQEVDGRTDLYALGTVLYEMVAGRLPFAGDYEQAVLYAILNEPPEPLTALRTGVPMDLERITSKLLSKEAEYRYQTAGDLLADLKSLDISGSGVSRRSISAVSAPTTDRKSTLPGWVYPALAVALVLGGLMAWFAKPVPQVEPPVRHVEVDMEPALSTTGRISLSRDGNALATFSREEQGIVVALRFFDAVETRLLESYVANVNLTLSPDARWVAYYQGGNLYRLPVDGGSPQIIAPLAGSRASWLSETELISDGMGFLWNVQVTGDTTRLPLDVPDSSYVFQPDVIPGTDALLATVMPSTALETARIYAFDLASGSGRAILPRGAYAPRWHSSGYVIFYQNLDLYAARFDPKSMEVGPSFTLQPGVANTGPIGIHASFDVSDDLLAFQGYTGTGKSGRQVLMGASSASLSPLTAEDRQYWDPRISPDGTQILSHASTDDSNTDVWLIDVERGTTRRLTTDPGEQETPFWAPSGRAFYYSSDRDGVEYLVRQTIDNSAPVDTLYQTSAHMHVESVSSDDRFVVLMLRDRTTNDDLWLVDTNSPGDARPLLATSVNESAGRISPDGRWLAYQTDETDRDEIYIAQFPEMLAPQLVSPNGGQAPVWSDDGQSLFYLEALNLMRVAIDNGVPGVPDIALSTPVDYFVNPPHTTFDVVGNGEEFVFIKSPGEQGGRTEIQLISGLATLLKRLDPLSD